MAPGRYAAPLSIIDTRTETQRKCPYCRWETNSLYRLDSWPDDYAGCASCVLEALVDDDEYLIYRNQGRVPRGLTRVNPDYSQPTDDGFRPAHRPTESASLIGLGTIKSVWIRQRWNVTPPSATGGKSPSPKKSEKHSASNPGIESNSPSNGWSNTYERHASLSRLP